ncbi:TRAP transporter substrate-binding protein [Sansalvadorimonas sp. 2012CJ34-2]|uniref:TRAP transporter substrate-binding protein n=1 Tax=Parendozoicomonas callyspongiae TaxID=2942213 RepID=A0ABT0PBF6_9GAMM|nr:TRAP transporter substrate-binding protein [Sansalvadorimonas sp. 2012CJ34-2]MCL6268613.1 TRAP transporter substrate-binding protein [Sansalvadorimonas sp. 2012CJ34-2]
MKRRQILTALGVGVLSAALAGCGGSNEESTVTSTDSITPKQKTYNWKLVTSWPKNFPGLGTAPERFADMVTEMSGGRLNVKVYGAGELVPALEVFDAVQNGTAEMGHSGAYYWKGKNPATQFFTAVPFGLNAQEMSSWLHNGGGMELWDELYAQFNLKPFAGGSTGVQMAGWFNRKIESLEDLKGLKMRIPGLGGEVLKRLGGSPVNVPGGELFTALQTGSIDATEWVGPYNDMAFGLYKAAKYYYYPGWHEPGSTLEFTVNLEAWNALPDDLKAIVEAATKATHLSMLDEYTARNNAALQQLKNDHGVEVLKLPDDVLAGLHKVADTVAAEVAASNPSAGKIYASFKKFAEQAQEYHQISEMAYYDARQL